MNFQVVNALLTQLDKLKVKRNVLVMTTSNIAGAIGKFRSPFPAWKLTGLDSAFVDRADIKEYVGYPPPQAVYWIITGCLKELMAKGMIRECKLHEWQSLGMTLTDGDRSMRISRRIKALADKCYVSSVYPFLLSTRMADGIGRATRSPAGFYGDCPFLHMRDTSRPSTTARDRDASNGGSERWSGQLRMSGSLGLGSTRRTGIEEEVSPRVRRSSEGSRALHQS